LSCSTVVDIIVSLKLCSNTYYRMWYGR